MYILQCILCNKTCHRFTNNGKKKKISYKSERWLPHMFPYSMTGNISCVVVEGWGVFRRHILLMTFSFFALFSVVHEHDPGTWTHNQVNEAYFCSAPIKQECKTLDIQFHLLHGPAGQVLPGFVSDRSLGAVVTDFSPLREPLQCLEDVKKKLPKDIPLIQVKTCCRIGRLSLLDWFAPFSFTDYCLALCVFLMKVGHKKQIWKTM